jgi:hypothetical protein
LSSPAERPVVDRQPPPLPRWHPAVLAGAVWAAVAVQLVRRRLKQKGLRAHVPAPPRLNPRAGRGVRAVLRRLAPTCLERALVEQAWMTAMGNPRDVVIGVLPGGMKQGPAHAWVDGTDPRSAADYLELHRMSPPGNAGLPR